MTTTTKFCTIAASIMLAGQIITAHTALNRYRTANLLVKHYGLEDALLTVVSLVMV
jgi:hypothetical protein